MKSVRLRHCPFIVIRSILFLSLCDFHFCAFLFISKSLKTNTTENAIVLIKKKWDLNQMNWIFQLCNYKMKVEGREDIFLKIG